jgi:hypothetical protein
LTGRVVEDPPAGAVDSDSIVSDPDGAVVTVFALVVVAEDVDSLGCASLTMKTAARNPNNSTNFIV